jgi:hypothetical protein
MDDHEDGNDDADEGEDPWDDDEDSEEEASQGISREDWDKDLDEEAADRAYEEASDKWAELDEERCEGLAHGLSLEDLPWLTPGLILNVEYDFCSETRFHIRFDSIQETKARLPHVVPAEAEEVANTFVPYTPPANSQNIDMVYPLANDIMFASGKAVWVCPYPTSGTSAGFVEGGAKYGSDIVFLAVTSFSGLHEALVAIEKGMKEYPELQGVSRMMFPIKMSKDYEERFQASEKYYKEFLEFKKTYNPRDYHSPRGGMDFDKFGKLPENIQYQLMCADSNAVLRVTPEDMKKYDDAVLQETFPRCTRAYHKGLWASYRRGKVLVAEGHDTGERGIPTKILAQVAQPNLTSLHDFFCVCETLFARVEADRTYQSLQNTAQTEPAILAGSSK